jgi:hypothetical protein
MWLYFMLLLSKRLWQIRANRMFFQAFWLKNDWNQINLFENAFWYSTYLWSGRQDSSPTGREENKARQSKTREFRFNFIHNVNGQIVLVSGVTTMGSDRANPGAPNPNRPNGGPKAQAIEQKHQPGRPLICYNVVFWPSEFSDHQNSVKSLPKVQEMAFQRVWIQKFSR